MDESRWQEYARVKQRDREVKEIRGRIKKVETERKNNNKKLETLREQLDIAEKNGTVKVGLFTKKTPKEIKEEILEIEEQNKKLDRKLYDLDIMKGDIYRRGR